MVFSDSELEEIDEESSSDSEAGSDYAAEKADRPAVKALLHMKLVMILLIYSIRYPYFQNSWVTTFVQTSTLI